MMNRRISAVLAGLAALALATGCGDSVTGAAARGTLSLRLTDAPFPTDSAESIDVYIVRIEARVAAASEGEAAADVQAAQSSSAGWITIAEPNAAFNLLDLQGGVSVALGQALVDAGTYRGLRLILDTEQSGVTLKGGFQLTGTSTPNILFPSAGQTGLKILLDEPIVIEANGQTNVLIDFDAGGSFVLRGNTIMQNGLLFTPVLNASVTVEPVT